MKNENEVNQYTDFALLKKVVKILTRRLYKAAYACSFDTNTVLLWLIKTRYSYVDTDC